MARPQNNNGARALVPDLPAQNADVGFDEFEGHFAEIIRDENGDPLIVQGNNIVPVVNPNLGNRARNPGKKNSDGASR